MSKLIKFYSFVLCLLVLVSGNFVFAQTAPTTTSVSGIIENKPRDVTVSVTNLKYSITGEKEVTATGTIKFDDGSNLGVSNNILNSIKFSYKNGSFGNIKTTLQKEDIKSSQVVFGKAYTFSKKFEVETVDNSASMALYINTSDNFYQSSKRVILKFATTKFAFNEYETGRQIKIEAPSAEDVRFTFYYTYTNTDIKNKTTSISSATAGKIEYVIFRESKDVEGKEIETKHKGGLLTISNALYNLPMMMSITIKQNEFNTNDRFKIKIIKDENISTKPHIFTLNNLNQKRVNLGNTNTNPGTISTGSTGNGTNGSGSDNGTGSGAEAGSGSATDDDSGDNSVPPTGQPSTSPTKTVLLQNPLREGLDTIPAIAGAIVENIVIPIALPFLAMSIIWTGFLFVKARGKPDEITKAKEALKWTIIGGLLILGSFLIATALQGTIKDIMGR